MTEGESEDFKVTTLNPYREEMEQGKSAEGDVLITDTVFSATKVESREEVFQADSSATMQFHSEEVCQEV